MLYKHYIIINAEVMTASEEIGLIKQRVSMQIGQKDADKLFKSKSKSTTKTPKVIITLDKISNKAKDLEKKTKKLIPEEENIVIPKEFLFA